MVTQKIAGLAKRVLHRIGYCALPAVGLAVLEREAAVGRKATMLGMIGEGDLRRALDLLPRSASQLNQDLFVLAALGWKRDGYFVEFGAADGLTLSNTLLLERDFGWRGILAEPGRFWRPALEASDRSAALDFDCVWSRSGERLTFAEDAVAEFSTLRAFAQADTHVRHATASYDVATVSLADLLDRHGAPRAIDYLSIDTEGSEFDILAAFDFDRFRFGCITCEHNFTPARERIHALLASKGYCRVFDDHSQFDDWYVYRG